MLLSDVHAPGGELGEDVAEEGLVDVLEEETLEGLFLDERAKEFQHAEAATHVLVIDLADQAGDLGLEGAEKVRLVLEFCGADLKDFKGVAKDPRVGTVRFDEFRGEVDDAVVLGFFHEVWGE